MTRIAILLSALVVALAALVAAGCEGASETGSSSGDSDSDSDNDSDSDSDSDNDTDSDTDSDTDTDTVCDEQNFPIEYVPVKLLIALDMSGSMVIPEYKYTQAVEAISAMLTTFEGAFLIGFDTYPDVWGSQSCVVDSPIWFDCDWDQEPAIIEWLNTNAPVLGTGDPLVREMDMLLNDSSYAFNCTSEEVPGEPYLLVVADGDDCCGPDGNYSCGNSWVDELVERTAALLEMGVKTITVGYGDNADETALDAIAAAGGTEFTEYLPAADADALQDALETVGGSIISCVFEIDEPDASADPDNVNFYFDDEVVPYDEDCAAGIGWTWVDPPDNTMIEFCEEACNQLQDGLVDEVSAKFGCPTEVIE